MITSLYNANIAIVGGGKFCKSFLEFISDEDFAEDRPKIIGVSDLDKKAPGLLYAKNMGFLTTNDYRFFYNFDELDIILEITNGSLENLPQETINFLNAFFVVIKIDHSKKEIKTAFQEFQKNYYDMLKITKNSDTVGETIMEKIVNMFEKDGHKFDYKVMIFWIATLTIPFLFKPVRESCENLVDDHSDKLRLGLGTSAALLCSWMTKNMLFKKGTKSRKGLIYNKDNIQRRRYTKTEIASIITGILATVGTVWASIKLAKQIKSPPKKQIDVSTQTRN